MSGLFRSLSAAAALAFCGSVAVAQGVAFSDVDANGDGLLDRSEMRAAFGSRGDSLLEQDVDGDGLVSLGEARDASDDEAEAVEAEPAGRPHDKALAFSVIDLDGDGLLSHKEMVTTFGRNGAGLLSKDRNGDGYVSKDEVRGAPGGRERGRASAITDAETTAIASDRDSSSRGKSGSRSNDRDRGNSGGRDKGGNDRGGSKDKGGKGKGKS